jgi:hypothetical protein
MFTHLQRLTFRPINRKLRQYSREQLFYIGVISFYSRKPLFARRMLL